MSTENTAPSSPFAAPAQTAPTAASPATEPAEMGDTSYLDNVPSSEPTIKPCTVPGVVRSFEIKEGQSGDAYINIAVQVYGDKMVNELNEPVSPGKRLTTSIFPFSKAEKESIDRKGRDLRNLLFALYDVPLDGNEMKVFATWPPTQKPGMLKPKTLPDGTQRVAWSLFPFNPTSKWTDTKVMVQIRKGKDMDGNPKTEFSLLAASTKPVERKGR